MESAGGPDDSDSAEDKSVQEFSSLRAQMVEHQLRRRGIGDERVLEAMGSVPREHFLPPSERRRAYNDSALPIGEGQTISQPWIVAAICSALELTGIEKVLEVGTGSGYSACVLSRLAAEVLSIERDPGLAAQAEQRLGELGTRNVRVVVADGSRGAPEGGPFDAIAVHATAPAAPPSLLAQLAPEGRMVLPIASDRADMLTLIRRRNGDLEYTEIGPCRFVPLLGGEGFPESS